MSLRRKRVAIIGGGFSGIAATKMVSEEDMEPICFEKSDNFGGTWFYREEDIEGLPSVMSTTTINHSKEFSSLSDFPFPKEIPNYLRHFEMYHYFKLVVEHFDLARYITCNREVVLVKKASDYEEMGRWSVSVKNTNDGSIITEIFDGVLVCVGHICYPKMAQYSDIEKFSGKIMHTHSLKRFEKFIGQRVVVVGTGCSALDAAAEISAVAQQVYLSVRTPSWILTRFGPDGLPTDYAFCRRYNNFFQQVLPFKFVNWIIGKYLSVTKYGYTPNGIEPKYPLLGRDPIINDVIRSKLLSGEVVLRKDVQYFVEDGVVFNGEIQETKVDTVIMATGYTCKFDFLEEGTVQVEDGRFNLYKCMYPTQLKHPTLAIIGFFLPNGPGFPVGELQLRWASRLLANRCPFPSEKVRLQDAKKRHEANVKRYSPSDKMSIRVDFMPYMDEIATELGVKPNFWKMVFTEPKLFLHCIFGPCLPFQYRLEGPHKWDGAKKAIFTSSERVQAALPSEKLKNKSKENSRFKMYILKKLLVTLMIICVLSIFENVLLTPSFLNFRVMMVCFFLTTVAFIYCNLRDILVHRIF